LTPVLPERPGLDDQTKQYLNLFRKYMDFCKEGPFRPPVKEKTITVLKYSFALSNKEFKRQWVKTHGTSAGLNSLPRVAVQQRSIRVYGLEYWFSLVAKQEKLLRKLLTRLQQRGSRLPMLPSTDSLVKTKKDSTSVKPGVRPYKRDRLATRLQSTKTGQQFFQVIGGLTVAYEPFKPPPKKEWTKYWYYYRNRGFWKPSEHHRYGDEHLILG